MARLPLGHQPRVIVDSDEVAHGVDEPLRRVKRRKRKRGGKVDGATPWRRIDKKARGGSLPLNPTHDGPPAGPRAGLTKPTAPLTESKKLDPMDWRRKAKGGRLSMAERKSLPSGDFALPGKGSGPSGKGSGSYPIPDESHARNALARVSQHGSAAQKATVRRKVHAKYPGIHVSK